MFRNGCCCCCCCPSSKSPLENSSFKTEFELYHTCTRGTFSTLNIHTYCSRSTRTVEKKEDDTAMVVVVVVAAVVLLVAS